MNHKGKLREGRRGATRRQEAKGEADGIKLDDG